MDTNNLKLCRLCLKILGESNFALLENITMEMMEVLLLDFDFLTIKEALICIACHRILKTLFFFKSMCLDTEESINQYIRTKKMLKVDLKDVYWCQRINKPEVYPNQLQKVCRFCLNLYEHNALNEIKEEGYLMDVLKKHYPELDLNTTDSISACEGCLDCLIEQFNFITNCLDTENTVNSYCQLAMINKADFVDFGSILDYSLKYHGKVPEYALNEEDLLMKKIKLEERYTKMLQQPSELGIKESNYSSSSETEQKLQSTSEEPHENVQQHTSKGKRKKKRSPKKQLFSCDQCSFSTKHKQSFKRHTLIHTRVPDTTIFKCPHCTFQGKGNWALRAHMTMHVNKNDTVLNKHNQDGLRLRNDLSKREDLTEKATCLPENDCVDAIHDGQSLQHKRDTKLATFKCEFCPYTSKHKGNIKNHTLVHKNCWEVTMHKCEECPFQTKHKISLKTHMLRHKSDSEVRLFKCQFCEFKAKYKGNLKLHELVHKDAFEAVMYKCEKCPFETKHKMSLRNHMLLHRKLTDDDLHKCEFCNFKTLHKGNLKKHVLKHKDPWEVEMFECDACDFMTKHKESLKMHVAKHFA